MSEVYRCRVKSYNPLTRKGDIDLLNKSEYIDQKNKKTIIQNSELKNVRFIFDKYVSFPIEIGDIMLATVFTRPHANGYHVRGELNPIQDYAKTNSFSDIIVKPMQFFVDVATPTMENDTYAINIPNGKIQTDSLENTINTSKTTINNENDYNLNTEDYNHTNINSIDVTTTDYTLESTNPIDFKTTLKSMGDLMLDIISVMNQTSVISSAPGSPSAPNPAFQAMVATLPTEVAKVLKTGAYIRKPFIKTPNPMETAPSLKDGLAVCNSKYWNLNKTDQTEKIDMNVLAAKAIKTAKETGAWDSMDNVFKNTKKKPNIKNNGKTRVIYNSTPIAKKLNVKNNREEDKFG